MKTSKDESKTKQKVDVAEAGRVLQDVYVSFLAFLSVTHNDALPCFPLTPEILIPC